MDRRGRALLGEAYRSIGKQCDDEPYGFDRALTSKTRANCVDNLLARGHYAQRGERSAIDNDFAIDENLVLAVASVNHLGLDAEITPKLRRRTDGVKSGDSVSAVTNYDTGHRVSSFTPSWASRVAAGSATRQSPHCVSESSYLRRVTRARGIALDRARQRRQRTLAVSRAFRSRERLTDRRDSCG